MSDNPQPGVPRSADGNGSVLRRLSQRQREIAERYAAGLTYRQIAAELFIAPATVRNHLAMIYRELGIGNKADLVRTFSAATKPDDDAQPALRVPLSNGYVLKPWLQSLGLEDYTDRFAANAIDHQTLPMLDDDDLQAMGIKKLGHRKKLLRAITELAVAGQDPDTPLLAALGQPERRHLTVMVCELIDASTLAARLDPEDLSAIIHAYHNVCADVIERYDGHINHAISGSILVYFGYPQAHADNTERALRAGLAIVDAIGQFNAHAESTVQVRIGVACGAVVCEGSSGSSQSITCIIGQPPDRAAELVRLADPNSVLVESRVRRLTQDRFRYQDRGETTLNGFSEPLRVWRLLGRADT